MSVVRCAKAARKAAFARKAAERLDPRERIARFPEKVRDVRREKNRTPMLCSPPKGIQDSPIAAFHRQRFSLWMIQDQNPAPCFGAGFRRCALRGVPRGREASLRGGRGGRGGRFARHDLEDAGSAHRAGALDGRARLAAFGGHLDLLRVLDFALFLALYAVAHDWLHTKKL